MTETRGSCFCEAVKFVAHAAPDRVGLCHCMDCRSRHGAPFKAFVVFRAGDIAIDGKLEPMPSRTGRRYACANCHVQIYWTDEAGREIEVSLGNFDSPGLFTPQYESWVGRREPWLKPLDVPQYPGNRPAS
ncbi:GFA family protein [Rhodanobacter sp. Col0626]|uniref:GFA family protein n=1 Tax=Rhodanobacter sp. Col0626 TaxID=3415679 RepID=UPI003CE7A0F4